MKAVLYNPPTWYYLNLHWRSLPMLSLAIVGAVLVKAGWDVSIIDLEAISKLPDEIDVPDADWVGFTVVTCAVRGAQDCIKSLRAKGYKGMIAVGGIHPTTCPQEALAWGADLVVTGECEGNIAVLLASRQTGIHAGEPVNIDEIPLPNWDIHRPNISTYTGNYHIIHQHPGVSMWARGCPYKCIFCSNLIYNGQPTRYYKPERIEADMRDLHTRGVRSVYVYDDELVGTQQPDGWMREIADRIEPIGLRWITQGRCSSKHITVDLMRDMYRAGCRAIFWGVESFSPNVLKAIHKGTTPADIWHSLKAAKVAGIKNGLFTMIGNYKETIKDAEITFKSLRTGYENKLIDFRTTFATNIMPGTELERIAKKEGWYQSPVDGFASQTKPAGTPWMSKHQVDTWMKRYDRVCPRHL